MGIKFKLLLIANILIVVGCGNKVDSKSPKSRINSFRQFSGSFSIPMPQSISKVEIIDIPGCSIGRRYQTVVPFKSRSLIEFYDRDMSAMGFKKNPPLDFDAGPWFEYPIPNQVKRITALTSEEEYFSSDDNVRCTVSLQYFAEADSSSSSTFGEKDSIQTVVASCEPNIPLEVTCLQTGPRN